MRRFIKEEVLKDKSGNKLLEVDLNKDVLPLKKIDVGNNARRVLNLVKSEEKELFLFNIKKFYVIIIEYLLQKLPLKNKLLQSLQILHPIVKKEPVVNILPTIRRLCNMLPHIVPQNCVDKLTDEWHLYANEDVPEETENIPIDKYWNNVFVLKDGNGDLKYPFLTKLVKAVLSVSHEQASVERGFSISKRMMINERSRMNLNTLVGLRLIKDSVRENASCVEITKEMIQFYKEAHSKYKAEKEKEKLKNLKKKSLEPKPSTSIKKSTEEKLKGFKENVSSAQAMIEEGNQRLKQGLKRKSMADIEAGQALIDAGNKKLDFAE